MSYPSDQVAKSVTQAEQQPEQVEDSRLQRQPDPLSGEEEEKKKNEMGA
jgi:hypothetical protein